MPGDRAVRAFGTNTIGHNILTTECRLSLVATIVNDCVHEAHLGFLELGWEVGSLLGRYLCDGMDQGIIVVGVEITV
jgi:hypothetical protein